MDPPISSSSKAQGARLVILSPGSELGSQPLEMCDPQEAVMLADLLSALTLGSLHALGFSGGFVPGILPAGFGDLLYKSGY